MVVNKITIFAFLGGVIVILGAIYLSYTKGYQAGQDSEKTAQQIALEKLQSKQAIKLKDLRLKYENMLIPDNDCGSIEWLRENYRSE